MQNDAPVNLRQVRDFGETFTATSTFIRQNWRPLYRALGILCLPPILVVGFLLGQRLSGFLGTVMGMQNDPTGLVDEMVGFYVMILVGYLFIFLVTILAIALVHEYIRAYHLGMHHGITTKQLWQSARQQYGSYLGAGFLSGLLLGVGFMLCFFPGFFPLTVLSLVLVAHAIERTGGAEALSRSYKLVMHSFWPTLGLILVLGIIMIAINWAIQLIFYFISAGMMLGGIEDAAGSGDPSEILSGFGLIMVLQIIVQTVVQLIIYPYIWVALSVRYFSLVEETEGAGLRERVQGFEQAS